MDSPKRLAVSATSPTPIGSYSQKLWGFIFLVLEPWAAQSGLGLGSLAPNVSLPILSSHECGTTSSTGHLTALSCLATAIPHPLHPCSPALPLLPIWMNVASLNPSLSDFHTVQFSGCSGFFHFGVSCDPSYCCARRQNVSTYASILTGSSPTFLSVDFFWLGVCLVNVCS